VLGQTTGGPFSTHGLRHDVAEMQFHPSLFWLCTNVTVTTFGAEKFDGSVEESINNQI